VVELSVLDLLIRGMGSASPPRRTSHIFFSMQIYPEKKKNHHNTIPEREKVPITDDHLIAGKSCVSFFFGPVHVVCLASLLRRTVLQSTSSSSYYSSLVVRGNNRYLARSLAKSMRTLFLQPLSGGCAGVIRFRAA
jgi:hypothetical protein